MQDYIQQMQRTGSINPVTGAVSSANPSSSSKPVGGRQEPGQAGTASTDLLELREQLASQKNQFERYVQLSQQRMTTLEREVKELRDEFSKASQLLGKISDKQTVEKTREALFNHKEKAPMDKPIDRNNVAPKDVQIGNIFNMSGKRF